MIRIGTVPYLVAKPLTAGLAQNPEVRLEVATPAELELSLRNGRLDVALASSILALGPDPLSFWTGGPVVASHGPVHSVQLFLRPGLEHPSGARTVLLDPHSRTGRGMARILLKDFFGAAPLYADPPLGECPFQSGADAVQLIGDPALRALVEQKDWQNVDLGETWLELTRLPFVYAGWVSRPGFDVEIAAPLLKEAAAFGMQQREKYIDEALATLPLDATFLRRYLYEDMRYILAGKKVRQALAEFESRLPLLVS
jgi:chorismate dehydratase